MSRKRIKLIVDNLLDQADLRKLPIDLDKIADLINVNIRTTDLEPGLSGFAFQKNGTKLIGINADECYERRRFTIAHEFGHLFLHKDMAVNLDKGIMMLRNEHSSDGTDLKEIEANRFAAELLMPEDEVRKDMAQAPNIDFMSESSDTKAYIKGLAQKYAVSPRAMSVRITTLYFN